ncbi:hypothetical protein [Pseudactinotalea terrae]|uniref:hypothetical protein n=1 Tax=Pseudactinotalea terrae TaxID=1743262 RepID=UPI0012E0C813|nr:hypothetical protein [Pseudactinotalea terrae]
MPEQGGAPSSALAALLRWECSGGTWAVLQRSTGALEISLRTCTAGEEVERLTSTDADVRDHVGDRERSDDEV